MQFRSQQNVSDEALRISIDFSIDSVHDQLTHSVSPGSGCNTTKKTIIIEIPKGNVISQNITSNIPSFPVKNSVARSWKTKTEKI
jgi:hypothetical protein